MPSIATDTLVDRFDRLATDLAAAIVRLRTSEVETTIVTTLRRIAEALEADSVSFESFGDTAGRPALRVWTRPGTGGGGTSPGLVTVTVEGQTVAQVTIAHREGARSPHAAIDDRLQLIAHLLVLAAQRAGDGEGWSARSGQQAPSHWDDADREEIIGDSPAVRAAMTRVLEVAPTGAPVVLLGETGTGKELFARAIHNRSARRHGPFVRVNCAALPPALIESELFGHERGAFTGATSTRQGRFELAQGGTIFLDEIGDLPAGVQTKLLRVLQDREFERAGSSHARHVNVRIVAATHHDLEQAVQDGRFRADLYYRLHVYPIALPPLRERLDDIPRLVWFFINRRQRALNRRFTTIPPGVMDALQRHAWPGNVRELENVIDRAMVHSTGNSLRLDEGTWLRVAPEADETGTLEAVERRHIESVLRRCRGRINGPGNAAEALGMHPNTLRFRMKKLGIRRPVEPAAFGYGRTLAAR